MKRDRAVAGFTLIELVAAVAVVGVLVTFALPSLGEVRRSAQRSAARASMHSVIFAQANHRQRTHWGYGTMAEVAQAASMTLVPTPQNLIDAGIPATGATARNGAYYFTIEIMDAQKQSYQLHATPIEWKGGFPATVGASATTPTPDPIQAATQTLASILGGTPPPPDTAPAYSGATCIYYRYDSRNESREAYDLGRGVIVPLD